MGRNGVLFDGPVHDLTVYGGELIACGDFSNAGATPARRIAAWNGTSWRPLASGLRGRLDEVRALAVYGGELIAAGAVSTPCITRWNGTRWTSLGNGVGTQAGDEIRALALYGGELFAAGDFREASSVQVGGIARWNGSRWAAVGDATRGSADTLTVWNGELVATGDLRPPDTSTSRTVAAWNGTRWATFGDDQQIGGYPQTGASYDGTLHLGGVLFQAGSIEVEGITSWNGSAWAPVDGGANERVGVIGRHRDELTIGGFFTRTGPGSSGGPRSGSVQAALLGRYTLAGSPWFAATDVPVARTVCSGGFITISAPLALGYDSSPGLVRIWRRNGIPLVSGPTPHGSFLFPFEDLTIVGAKGGG